MSISYNTGNAAVGDSLTSEDIMHCVIGQRAGPGAARSTTAAAGLPSESALLELLLADLATARMMRGRW